MRCVVLWPDKEQSTPGIPLMSLTKRVHSAGAILSGRKYFSLMYWKWIMQFSSTRIWTLVMTSQKTYGICTLFPVIPYHPEWNDHAMPNSHIFQNGLGYWWISSLQDGPNIKALDNQEVVRIETGECETTYWDTRGECKLCWSWMEWKEQAQLQTCVGIYTPWRASGAWRVHRWWLRCISFIFG
jgi:hypothetical protein